VDRGRRHRLLEQTIVAKDSSLAVSPSLSTEELALLADRGLTIERHFACPQDIEWAFDESGQLWILQSRPLAMAAPSASRDAAVVREAPLLSGGRTVYPGRASGPVHLVAGPEALGATPDGAILALRRASPEIVEVFPRIAGLVAEWGNLTGHAAALLREFRIPSAFHLPGALEHLAAGDAVSLDATAARVYAGILWPPRERGTRPAASRRDKPPDPVEERLLALRLLDPTSFRFRPASCRSVHDVLRFCHEKAIEAMFVANDDALEHDAGSCRRLLSPAPLDLHVLDLGGGLSETAQATAAVDPSQIRSRPFQALWRGVSHPDVTWTRRMPARLSDLASVMASSLAPQSGAMRALGERSYLLVADEYMNLNSRLSFHFTLIDACVSETPAHNYISFRFAGGGPVSSSPVSFTTASVSTVGATSSTRGSGRRPPGTPRPTWTCSAGSWRAAASSTCTCTPTRRCSGTSSSFSVATTPSSPRGTRRKSASRNDEQSADSAGCLLVARVGGGPGPRDAVDARRRCGPRAIGQADARRGANGSLLCRRHRPHRR
jgi:pyruvate,water dikinase